MHRKKSGAPFGIYSLHKEIWNNDIQANVYQLGRVLTSPGRVDRGAVGVPCQSDSVLTCLYGSLAGLLVIQLVGLVEVDHALVLIMS